jgi:alpha-beta hydrolase superfamily lysophospholipase
MRKRIRRLAFVLALYLGLCAAAALILVSSTLHPQRRHLPTEAEVEMREVAARLNSELDDVQIATPDDAILRAWFVQPQKGFTDTVILLHGLGDNRLGTIGYAEMFLRSGYAVLMPDARAHGVSGGAIATYGLLERDDIRRWFEWIESNEHPHCIFGLGESMGAAQLLQSLAAEPNFCAIVAESSFSTFREIAYDRMGQQFHAGPWVGRTVLRPVVEIALLLARVEDHVNLAEASPEDAAAHSNVPVLLIHGTADSNIPVRHSRRIRSRFPRVQLWEVAGADHCGAISIAPDEFQHKVLDWFQTNDHPHRDEHSPKLVSK